MSSPKARSRHLYLKTKILAKGLLITAISAVVGVGCGKRASESAELAAAPGVRPNGAELFQRRLADFSTQIHPGKTGQDLKARFNRGEWTPTFEANGGLRLSESAVASFPAKGGGARDAMTANKVHQVTDTSHSVQVPSGSTLKNSDEETSRWDTKVSFGVEGKLFSVVSIAAKETVTYAVTTSKQLFLVKERKDDNTQMISSELVDQTDSHGQPMLGANGQALKKGKLVTDDGLRFVFQCAYNSKTENSIRSEASVSFSMGVTASVAGGHEDGNISNITATSEWYNVEPSDTLYGLLDFCQDAFAQKTKHQVKREIENYMAGAVYDEAGAARNRSLLISAALYGDKASRIEVDGHHWNAPRASIDNAEPGIVKVTGRLEHNIATQTDDVMNYNCIWSLGKETKFDVDIKQHSATSGWRDIGRGIIKDICHDAFVEFAKDAE